MSQQKNPTLLLTCLIACFITLNEADSEIYIGWNDEFGKINSSKSRLLFATYFPMAKDSLHSLLYSVEYLFRLPLPLTKQLS